MAPAEELKESGWKASIKPFALDAQNTISRLRTVLSRRWHLLKLGRHARCGGRPAVARAAAATEV